MKVYNEDWFLLTIKVVSVNSICKSICEFGSIGCGRARLTEPSTTSPSTYMGVSIAYKMKYIRDVPMERTMRVP